MGPHRWRHLPARLRDAVRHDLLRTSQLAFLLAQAVTVVAGTVQIVRQHAGGPGAAMCAAILLTILGLRVVEYRRGRTVPVWVDAVELAGVLVVMSQLSAVYPIISTFYSTILFRAAVGRPARLATSVAGYLTVWVAAAHLFPAVDLVPGAMISMPITSALVYSTRTLLLKLQDQQRAQSALLDAALRRLPFPVLVTGGTGDVVLVNPAAEELLGWPAGTRRSLGDLDLTDVEERPVDLRTLVAAHTATPDHEPRTAGTRHETRTAAPRHETHLAAPRHETHLAVPELETRTAVPELEVRLARAGGDRHLKVRTVPMDDLGHAGGVVVALLDVTAQWAYQQHLHRAAYYDLLTGLPNRRLLWERLTFAHSTGGAYAMLLIDLNDFKTVNDTLGHTAGDELLAGVARRLVAAVDASAVVARLGGDEFAVMLPGAGRADAEAAADAVRRSFAEPLELTCGPVRSGGSVGLALGGPGSSPDEVIAAADAAMYHAKPSDRRRTRGQGSPRSSAT